MSGAANRMAPPSHHALMGDYHVEASRLGHDGGVGSERERVQVIAVFPQFRYRSGAMVAGGTQYFQFWWMGTFPGLALFTAVLAFNFLGDSFRDFFDPQTQWKVEKE